MVQQIIPDNPTLVDLNGDPLAGGSVRFYRTGTTTDVSLFSDPAGTIPQENPVPIDVGGRVPQVFYSDDFAVKAVLFDSVGAAIRTIDPCQLDSAFTVSGDLVTFSPSGANDATDMQGAVERIGAVFDSRADAIAAEIPATQVTLSVVHAGMLLDYVRDAAGTALTTADGQNWSPADRFTARHFGAVGDGVSDDTAAIQALVDHFDAGDPSACLELGVGVFMVSSPITITTDGTQLKGEGRGRAAGYTDSAFGGSSLLWGGGSLTAVEAVVMTGSASDQGRNIKLEEFSILCGEAVNGVYSARSNICEFRRIYIDEPVVGLVMKDACYSNIIDGLEIYAPVTGGMDFREDCHSVTVSNCAFNGNSAGTEAPDFGVRIAQDANCSNMVFFGNNFDYYRVDAHVELVLDCKGFQFFGNYIEAKGDGVTQNCIKISGGAGGSISGNRISSSDTPITTTVDYGVNIEGGAESLIVSANFFSGFDTSCVRIASGAHNIVVMGNETSGLSEITNQNTTGNKRTFSVNDGAVDTDSVSFEKIIYKSSGELTISAGSISVIGSRHTVDTEADAATDDLDTILGGVDGMVLYLQSSASSRDVVVKDATGNIQLNHDFALDVGRDSLALIYNGAASQWQELSRSSN